MSVHQPSSYRTAAENMVSIPNIGMGWIQAQAPNIFSNQHFTLFHIRKDNFSLFRYNMYFKMQTCFENNHTDCPCHTRRMKFMILDKMILLSSPLLILKYCQLVFKIFSYCSNSKIISISIFLLTVML